MKAERELNLIVRRQFCPALEALIEHGSRVPLSKGRRGVYEPKPTVLSSLLALLGCFSRNRLEGLSYQQNVISPTVVNGADDSEEEEEYEEEEEEADENLEANGTRQQRDLYHTESAEERRSRILRKRNAQSSAWAIFLKYYVLMVS